MAKKLKAIRKKKASVSIPQLPKSLGLDGKLMDAHLEQAAKLRARNDARVARNARDSMLRQFATAHLAAQTKANPRLAGAYFPSFTELPIPR